MEFENILVDTDGPVATITLNRPEKLNAMSDALRADLHDALVALNPGDQVRVIRLKGAGRAFCPGYDLSPGQPRPGREDAAADAGNGAAHGDGSGRLRRVRDLPGPRADAGAGRQLAVDVELPQADHRADA